MWENNLRNSTAVPWLVVWPIYLIRTAFEIESCKNVPHIQAFGALYFFGRYDVRRTDISPKLL